MSKLTGALKWGLAGAVLFGLAAAGPVSAAQGARFSAYIEDLPIMPGLDENTDGYVVELFQGGRMAEARMAGTIDAQVIRGFYAATLPQLGWKPAGAEQYVYRRGRERLTFTVEPRRARSGGRAPNGLEAVFMLIPDAPGIGAGPERTR